MDIAVWSILILLIYVSLHQLSSIRRELKELGSGKLSGSLDVGVAADGSRDALYREVELASRMFSEYPSGLSEEVENKIIEDKVKFLRRYWGKNDRNTLNPVFSESDIGWEFFNARRGRHEIFFYIEKTKRIKESQSEGDDFLSSRDYEESYKKAIESSMEVEISEKRAEAMIMANAAAFHGLDISEAKKKFYENEDRGLFGVEPTERVVNKKYKEKTRNLT